MDKNERNTMITNIVNFNRAVLMTNGKIKNREYLEKYRNNLDLMLKNS